MFINCPHCKGLVALDRDYGEPPERCPLCDGLLVAEPTVPGEEPVAAPTDETDAIVDPGNAVNEAIAAPEPAVPAASADVRPVKDGTTPSPRTRWEWLALPALALLLLLQLFALQHDALAADARWRPLLEGSCRAIGCSLPAWSEPQAIRLLQRSVQADPARAGVLQVHMRLRNEARWPQPWPQLRLTLSDVDGQPLASGVFAPRDYLGKPPAQALLAPGQQVDARFAVDEPARPSVAFDFQFLPSVTECGTATGGAGCTR